MTPTERQYVAALALAYDLAPEYEREEGHLEQAYNRACERLDLDPGAFLLGAAQRFRIAAPALSDRHQFYRGRLGR